MLDRKLWMYATAALGSALGALHLVYLAIVAVLMRELPLSSQGLAPSVYLTAAAAVALFGIWCWTQAGYRYESMKEKRDAAALRTG